ncbi:MAG TPA: hypothetical protein VIC82_09205 [Candidatus Nanopelagicales bacterium]
MTSAATAARADDAPTSTVAPAPAPIRTDHSFTVGWVLLGVGLFLTLGIFFAVAYSGSLLEADHTGVQRGTTPSTSTATP